MTTKLILWGFVALTALTGCQHSDALLQPGAPAGMLNLVNAADAPLTFVTITDCTAATPSASRLDAGEVVTPGASRRWAISQGCYEVQAGYDLAIGQSISDSRIQIGAERVFNLTVR